MSQQATCPRPPTLAELLPPPDEPMESARHAQQVSVLIESLDYAWARRSDFYLGGDMPLYYSETQTKTNDFRCPDLFVVLGTSRQPERRAWIVWEEGGKAPDLIIELLSESTEHVDRGEKKRIYSRSLKVPEYFLFDPFSGVLEGYDLHDVPEQAAGDEGRHVYVPKLPDSSGRFDTRLGLQLGKVRGTHYGVEADWLRWIDRSGRPLPMPREDAERANAETERANAEAERAQRLQAELSELKKKLAENPT